LRKQSFTILKFICFSPIAASETLSIQYKSGATKVDSL